MDTARRFTIQDALHRPLFKDARVVAGEDQLERPIRWVHILEVTRFEHLIRGGEMILTTGIAFRSGTDSPVTYLAKLIDLGVACLCIELGEYFIHLPQEMVELAERRGFPLIVFEKTVRFVDITQDLHSHIIHRHHDQIRQLESLSRQFHRLTLAPQGLENILKLLHEHCGHPVLFLPIQGTPLSIPTLPPEEREPLFTCIRARLERIKREQEIMPLAWEQEGRHLLLHPIQALGQTWAYLGLVCETPPEEYESLLLDGSSLAIAQDLLRKRYLEEKKLHSEHLWVNDWLLGRLSESDLLYHLDSNYEQTAIPSYRVFLLELPDAAPWALDDFRYEVSLMVRAAFEKQGFRPFITMQNARLAVVAFNQGPHPSEGSRLRHACQEIDHLCQQNPWNLQPLMGVGRLRDDLLQAPAALREAHQVLTVTRRESGFLFYEDLGVYQLLLHPGIHQNLTTFVRDHLGPVIDHDRVKGGDLLNTLRVYLDHNGSKKEVADKLHIVRQSLYYRLQKLESLLGKDYLSPDRKLTLQLALRAYPIVYSEWVKEDGQKK